MATEENKAIVCRLFEGDKVAFRRALTGTHECESRPGIAPTETRISTMETSVMGLEDGKVVAEWAVCDLMGMMQQSGRHAHTGAANRHLEEQGREREHTKTGGDSGSSTDPATRGR